MTPILDRYSRHGEEPEPGAVSAIHSGNIGDIVYALPTVRALGVSHLLLNVCEDPGVGGRLMTEPMAMSLVPLLLDQPGIRTVDIVGAPIRLGSGFGYQAKISRLAVGLPLEHVSPSVLGVDFVLDAFRLQPLERRHLVHAHAMAFGSRVDPAKAWIQPPPASEPGNGIAVSLTPRYRNRSNERLAEILDGFGPVTLIGFRSELPNYFGINGSLREFTDAGDLAAFLAGCSVFVGASSFPAALAEAMKVPRLIDLADGLINAFPVGPRGWAMPEATADARHLLDGLLRAPDRANERLRPSVPIAPPAAVVPFRFTLEWRQVDAEIFGTHRARAEATLGRAPTRVHFDIPRMVDHPSGFELVIDAPDCAFEVSNLRCTRGAQTLWTAREPDDLTVPEGALMSSPPGVLRWLLTQDGPGRIRIAVPDAVLARFRDADLSIVFDCRAPKPAESGQWAAREILALRAALARERASGEDLQNERAEAQHKRSDMEHRLTSLEESTSWRMTAPLRTVIGLVRPKPGGARDDV
jgi:hypothetical protein